MPVPAASTAPVSSRPATRAVFLVCLSVSLLVHALLLALNPTRPSRANVVSGGTGLQLEISRRSAPVAAAAVRHPDQPLQTDDHPAADRKTSPARAEPAGILLPAPAKAASAAARARATSNRPTGAALENLLHDKIHRAMQPYFNYPLLARRRGWQGTVKVSLRVEANGHLSQVRLVNPSPHAVLNRATMDNLKKVAAIPEAVQWLAGNHLDIVLPVEYRLLGS